MEEKKEATKTSILMGLNGKADAISFPSVSIIPHSIPFYGCSQQPCFIDGRLVAIAKSTQEIRGLERQISLAEGSKLVYRQHIFPGKNEEAEPHRSLFPNWALDLLQTSGTEMAKRLVDSSLLPNGLKTLTLKPTPTLSPCSIYWGILTIWFSSHELCFTLMFLLKQQIHFPGAEAKVFSCPRYLGKRLRLHRVWVMVCKQMLDIWIPLAVCFPAWRAHLSLQWISTFSDRRSFTRFKKFIALD